ncbi:MAG: response regulator transcription factor [Ruminococcaceae bacterium]|nr:response regulator transcription factor [Oscillospiraceae bacterium]
MFEKSHVLIIEDEIKTVNFMSMALRAKDYKVTSAQTGQAGILSFCTNNPDIILLDLGLPDMDGMKIIEEVRKVSNIPIMVVSGRKIESDIISALDAGANDYMTKPFGMGELLARVRVMERYITKENITKPNSIMQFGDLTIDTERRRIYVDNNDVHLTPLEYKFLVLLASNPGKVITHQQISKDVWGYREKGEAKSIRVCMASLRKKINDIGSEPKYIFTEIGVGYRFTDK